MLVLTKRIVGRKGGGSIIKVSISFILIKSKSNKKESKDKGVRLIKHVPICGCSDKKKEREREGKVRVDMYASAKLVLARGCKGDSRD